MMYRYYLLLLLSLPAAALPAQEIEIQHAGSNLISDAWYLDAKISFEFHADVIEALNNGVDLNIDIDILIREKRRWLWDKVIKESTIKFKLEHQPLADLYIVTHLSNYERVQFDDLRPALAYLGEISNYLLLDAQTTDAGKRYSGSISARLDVEALPPPLRPVAYLSNRWQVDSNPYVWSFR
ncbi:MAG: DUF4390 domain-containing protein [Gammaproteobacteria bacterium]